MLSRNQVRSIHPNHCMGAKAPMEFCEYFNQTVCVCVCVCVCVFVCACGLLFGAVCFLGQRLFIEGGCVRGKIEGRESQGHKRREGGGTERANREQGKREMF